VLLRVDFGGWRQMADVRMMRGCSALVIIVVLAVVAGCRDSGSRASGEPSNSVEVTPSSPPPEPTGPESPQPTHKKPAVRVASLPIGGDTSVDGLRQCADVNWLGTSPIPDGVDVSIDSISLDPEGVFWLDQESCGSSQQSCAERARMVDGEACSVGVRQVAAGDEDVTLVIAGTVTCEELPDCENLVGPDEGSQITFTPEDFEPSSAESPTGTSPESPSESRPVSSDESPDESSTG
jgi:hypothetical protein